MTKLRPLGNDYRYKRIIGTGGLGTGMFFKLQGNHTLGRNESRLGDRLPYRVYCKQHIILHYISVFLSGESFEVFPIGRVGDDEQGRQILREMAGSGMKMHGVKIQPGASTLFSVCFIYPDSTGGNITTSSSASSMVEPSDITDFMALIDGGGISAFGNEYSRDRDVPTIMLATPEVPVETRIQLLKEGRKRKFFNAASVLSGEVDEFCSASGFELTDLLSVNMTKLLPF